MCVCVVCVSTPVCIYSRQSSFILFLWSLHTHTHTHRHSRIKYIILYVIFPDDYFIQLETIVFINIHAFVLDKQNRVTTRREMTRRFLLVRYYNIIINRIPWPLYSIHTAESLGAVNYILRRNNTILWYILIWYIIIIVVAVLYGVIFFTHLYNKILNKHEGESAGRLDNILCTILRTYIIVKVL